MRVGQKFIYTTQSAADLASYQELVDLDAGGYVMDSTFSLSDPASIGLLSSITTEPAYSIFGLCVKLDTN